MSPVVRAAEEFLGLRRHDEGDWSLEIVPGVCGSAGSLFGGAGFAAALAVALHGESRSFVRASCAFRRGIRSPDTLELAESERKVGRRVTTSTVEGRTRGHPAIDVTAISTTHPRDRIFSRRLEAPIPDPDDCAERSYADPTPGLIGTRLDIRVAHAADEGGTCLLWARVRDVERLDPPLIALLSDHVAFALGQMTGHPLAAATLEIDLHLVLPELSGWLILGIEVDTIDEGAAHGIVRLWNEERSLVGVSTQTLMIAPSSLQSGTAGS
ncbi:MAG: thioesterase family protein [Deltaproteobacteria bacterium]|jgi:acyl-CoA thioesterase|nr:thioesterase family protein [Deltaproteobacteria bacterium]MBW2498826.1 thioesterase family protein [Deltaproteobacteria bacterium]